MRQRIARRPADLAGLESSATCRAGPAGRAGLVGVMFVSVSVTVAVRMGWMVGMYCWWRPWRWPVTCGRVGVAMDVGRRSPESSCCCPWINVWVNVSLRQLS
jgi:hypothetical protein